MDENEDESQNPLSEENWMKQNNCKFIKSVIHHRHPMTPEQLKQKLFEEIFKNQHENVDTDEGESIEEEEKSTTSSDMLIGKNIGQQYCWCSLMWLMPLKSLSNCDYEL